MRKWWDDIYLNDGILLFSKGYIFPHGRVFKQRNYENMDIVYLEVTLITAYNPNIRLWKIDDCTI